MAATGQNSFFNVAVTLRAARDMVPNQGLKRAASTRAALLAAEHGFQRGAGLRGRTRSPALLSRDHDETVVLAAFASEADATTAVSHVRANVARPRASAGAHGVAVRMAGSR